MSRPRSIQLFMVAFAICCTSLLGGDEESGNDLIQVGDFEGETVNFPKWHGADLRFENDGCIYCGPSKEEAFRGKQSCKIQTTGTRGDCLRYVCTEVKSGQAYRFEFQYKIKTGGIVISDEGGLSQRFRLGGSSPEWRTFSVTFVADQDQFVVSIGTFRYEEPNLVYVDDVKLIALDKLPDTFRPRPFRLASVPSRPANPASRTTLLAHFDEVVRLSPRYLEIARDAATDPKSPLLRPNADYARWNPLSAGRDTSLVAGGKFGKAVRLVEPRASVIFGGEDNCPLSIGTVEMFVKSDTAEDIWQDGEERWFTYLHRSRINDAIGRGGFTLQLFKDAGNHLVLACGKGRAIKIDVTSLDPDSWHHLLFGWDLENHRMYLSVNGVGQSASLPLPLNPGEFSTILLGNHPDQNLPAGCLVDELLITARAPTDRSVDTGKPVDPPRFPQPRAHKSVLAGQDFEQFDIDDTVLLNAERRVRNWLDWVVRSQHGGGWDTIVDSVRWPSMLLGGYTRLCNSRDRITIGKTYNTSHTAMHLCFAYEVFGDPYYFAAARRTADMYLQIQRVDHNERWGDVSRWPRSAYARPTGAIPSHGLGDVMIQDFYVTGPVLTLLYVHKLTGGKEYLDGAIRGGNFLLLAQNPNGSWPHHFDWREQAGFGTGSLDGPTGGTIRHGSELNDNATTDAMRTLVALWHWTKDERYLQAVRRAGDWVVEAQLDAPTYGWAAQYDSNNAPVWARAHEAPAAVWSNGASMASNALFLAHRLTGDEKYLKPLDQYLAALDKIRAPEGWYQQYDYKNGRPIAAREGKVYYLDDPQQVKAYQDAGGGSAGYWQPGAMKVEDYDAIKNGLAAAREGTFLPAIPKTNDRRQLIAVLQHELQNPDLHRDVDLMAVRGWIPEEGLWLSVANKFEAGPAFSPCSERPVRFMLRTCHLARAVLGDVPADQVFPLGGQIMDHRYHVIAKPGEYFQTPLQGK